MSERRLLSLFIFFVAGVCVKLRYTEIHMSSYEPSISCLVCFWGKVSFSGSIYELGILAPVDPRLLGLVFPLLSLGLERCYVIKKMLFRQTGERTK